MTRRTLFSLAGFLAKRRKPLTIAVGPKDIQPIDEIDIGCAKVPVIHIETMKSQGKPIVRNGEIWESCTITGMFAIAQDGRAFWNAGNGWECILAEKRFL